MRTKKNKPLFPVMTAQNKYDVRTSYIVAFYFLRTALTYLYPFIPIAEIVHLIFNIALISFIAFNFTVIIKRSLLLFVLAELFVSAMFFISILYGNAENRVLSNFAYNLILHYIPIAVYICSIKDKSIFYNIFVNISYIISSLLVLYYVLSLSSGRQTGYNMTYAYFLLVPVLLHITELLKKHRSILNVIFISIEMMVILLYGSRGPILCIGIFVVFKFITSEINLLKKIAASFLILFSLISAGLFFQEIGILIKNILSSMGYRSRTIELFFSGQILQDSGRSEVLNYYYPLIKEKPILGWGVGGGWMNEGMYPHNIVIELILSFGLFAGLLMCIFITICFFRIFMQKDGVLRDLLLIYFSASVPALMISHSFMGSFTFWIFILLSIKNLNKITAWAYKFNSIKDLSMMVAKILRTAQKNNIFKRV